MTKRETILLRQSVYRAIRSFFEAHDYLEVETPRLVASPDLAPNLDYFVTDLRMPGRKDARGALATSPEYGLKKLVSNDLPRIFELARVYRNYEPLDATHNPEFTLLEWYRLGGTIEDGIQETIQLIDAVARAVRGVPEVLVGGRAYSVEPSAWRIATIAELFKEHVGDVDLSAPTQEAYDGLLAQHGLSAADGDSLDDRFQRLFVHCIQPVIDASPEPLVVARYPFHAASLAQLDHNGMGERFEVYVGGLEICNAYGELTDAKEQRRRFEQEAAERQRLSKQTFPIDEALLEALDVIDRPFFGNALGVERLMMLVSGGSNIKDMLTFAASDLFKND